MEVRLQAICHPWHLKRFLFSEEKWKLSSSGKFKLGGLLAERVSPQAETGQHVPIHLRLPASWYTPCLCVLESNECPSWAEPADPRHMHTPQSWQLIRGTAGFSPSYTLGFLLLGLSHFTLTHTELCKVLWTWFVDQEKEVQKQLAQGTWLEEVSRD